MEASNRTREESLGLHVPAISSTQISIAALQSIEKGSSRLNKGSGAADLHSSCIEGLTPTSPSPAQHTIGGEDRNAYEASVTDGQP